MFRLSFTTNGTVFNKKIIQYLINKDAHLLISLDGDEPEHNRFRVYRNNKGTYRTVMRFLQEIRSTSEAFFQNNISFNAILTPPYNLKNTFNFFNHHPWGDIFKNKTNISFVDSNETTFYNKYETATDRWCLNDEMKKVRNHYKEGLIHNRYNDLGIMAQFFVNNFGNYIVDKPN